MKKLLLASFAAVSLASVVSAQTNVVLSRNAVGYIRLPLSSNKLYLVSNPFVPMTPTGNIVSVMLSGLPNGSDVFIWGEDIQAFRNYNKSLRGTWNTEAMTTHVVRADAFFIKMPPNASTTIYFMGEVPDRFTAPTTIQTRVPGLTMLGFPYPVTLLFTNTSMALSAPNGSTYSIWDSDTQNYVNYQKSNRGQWNTIATTAVVAVGQGFIINTSAGATNIATVKPYTWP